MREPWSGWTLDGIASAPASLLVATMMAADRPHPAHGSGGGKVERNPSRARQHEIQQRLRAKRDRERAEKAAKELADKQAV